MTDVECWAPECAVSIPVPPRGRHPKYCSGACRQRAVRRNGGKAPSTPYVTVPGAVTSPPVRSVPPAGAVAGTTAPASKPKRKTKRPAKPPAATFSDVPSPVGSVAEGGASVTAGDSPSVPEQPPADPEPVAPALSIVPPPSVPPAPEAPPEPLPPTEFYLSVVAELEAIGQHESRKGRQALAIAARMESPNTSAASVGSLSKELDRFLDEMKAAAPKIDDAGAIIGDRVRNKILQASRIGAAS